MRTLDHPVISERYFFPRVQAPESPTWVDVPGARLACARYDGPSAEAPVLLHFHGNGEVVADWADLAPGLVAAGFAPFFAEYRGYGGSTGRPMLDTQLDDALAIADAVGVPFERMVVYGRSVGSLYALHVAANRPVRALVLESGIADVGQRLLLRLQPGELGVSPDVFDAALEERFDHQAKIAATRCPVHVIHTVHDHMVDIEHARTLAHWAGERAELLELDLGDHNTIFAYNAPRILAEVAKLA
ncbi:MAG: alpha/beta hydrolase [Alphaproteobacteria bacterium]|nr:alpha/beta hydrolase [Alphaproteobacteria bacterium]